MASLTSYQANTTRVAVKTVRMDTAGPGMKSLTLGCQANRTRVPMRTVRRDTAGPDIESLTFYQANEIRVAVRTVRRTLCNGRIFCLFTLSYCARLFYLITALVLSFSFIYGCGLVSS